MNVVVNVYLTWKCNFFCDHCIHSGGPDGNHMTDEQIKYAKDFVEWVKSQGLELSVLGLTGGEPTMHPKFWTDIMPWMQVVRTMFPATPIEMHSNASIPIAQNNREAYAHFFNSIFVGHDPFHRKFKSLAELCLQDYTDITIQLLLRQQKWQLPYEGFVSSIRMKGRAENLLPSGKYKEIYANREITYDCWRKNGNTALNIDFTPDNIVHCGENKVLSTPYGLSFDELMNKALEYEVSHSRQNCCNKCYTKLIQPIEEKV